MASRRLRRVPSRFLFGVQIVLGLADRHGRRRHPLETPVSRQKLHIEYLMTPGSFAASLTGVLTLSIVDIH